MVPPRGKHPETGPGAENIEGPGSSPFEGWPYQKLLLATLSAICVFIYIWPALRGPVVLWSDSRIDLEWARGAIGILGPAPPAPPGEDAAHQAKPAYLAFLWAAVSLSPLDDGRTVVVVQSLLLAFSLLGTVWFLFVRRGVAVGGAFLAAMLLFLRTRDSASAVMPEAIATAALLPLAATLVEPPRKPLGAVAIGLLAGVLFWLRPNTGSVVLLLLVLRLLLARRSRAALLATAAFAAVFLPVSFARGPGAGADTLRGLTFPVLEASADYYWRPSLRLSSEEIEGQSSRGELRRALANWQTTLSETDTDTRRELLWRAFHGLLGTEYYDPSWSDLYRRLDFGSKVLSPFLILLGAALLLAMPFRGTDRGLNVISAVLLLLLVAQNLVIGSNSRYVLPFIPVLLLLAVTGFVSLTKDRPRSLILVVLIFGVSVLLARWHRGVLDAQWGRIESPGVVLTQAVPKGALPDRPPATLHIRIAPAALPTAAHLEVFGPGKRRLYDSRNSPSRHSADISVPLPGWLLEQNAREAVTLELVSSGDYGAFQYLLFPIIPPPWGSPAKRKGSPLLSPSTGYASGSLDWWAHAGNE